jgi:hypothetical protein
MDRKIKTQYNDHMDKPARQRWLYQLMDWGTGKAAMLIAGVCIVTLVVSLLIIRAIIRYTR